MSVTEIIEQIRVLPKEDKARVIEFVHQIEAEEMTDAELLAAARKAGTFAMLDAPGEDIYSTKAQ